ncbi:MAG: transcriptional regulator, GntR family, partial [Bryobacterales bacterium]|nr:transcriptional regulator, GntR family [Bryobacterales bacterium]
MIARTGVKSQKQPECCNISFDMERQPPRYQQVKEALEAAIRKGRYPPGARLPSESVLVKQFKTSRITVGRALRELQREGLIERRAGSGSFVRGTPPGDPSLLFGLLIPNLEETEIFPPILEGMTAISGARPHALLRGSTGTNAGVEKEALLLCDQYIARGVSGVFFAPLEQTPRKDEVNRDILTALDAALIPVVLLDRSELDYPRQSARDLVGIDNRRAGYIAAAHLLKVGCVRIGFVAQPNSASTVEGRCAGYREALFRHGASLEVSRTVHLDPTDSSAVNQFLRDWRPDAFVCANDRTAGQLMHTLIALGRSIPTEIRLVGIDDVRYSSLLPVPLTTVRQPCRQIGQVAIAAMLERIAHPELAARELLLGCELVIRKS